jgi:ribonuclease P/MRP protein subunit RPP40
MGKVAVSLASFLDPATRQQAVVVEGRISELSPVGSGVTQGTVLGPVMFLVHIRTIADRVSMDTTVSSFCDDTRAQRGILDITDCRSLQRDLQEIYSWADRVNMEFNADKFESIQIRPKSADSQETHYLAPDGSTIEVKSSLKDLGVHISDDLTFRVQVEKVVVGAARQAGWALRTFRRRSRMVMMTILRSLIQPRLDYCSQLWSPMDQESINKVEGVVRNFTSNIWGMEDLTYWERLSQLRLYSQERRRERYMVIFLWKISQGLVKGVNISFHSSDRRGRYAVPSTVPRGTSARVRRAREATLGVRGVQLFNLLPDTLRSMDGCTVDTWKSHLDQFLSKVPDQPTVCELSRAAQTNSLTDQISYI